MDTLGKVSAFCARFGIQVPVLLAPMAGASAPSLSVAVMRAGGLGACGGLLLQPEEIRDWAHAVRSQIDGPFQINLWVPDPPPLRDRAHEASIRKFLEGWGPEVGESAGDEAPPDFQAQCQAVVQTQASVISSVMGLFPTPYVSQIKAAGRSWFATVSTVSEAKQAEAAGADVIVVQGMEAGGHRAAFRAERAAEEMVGLFSLLPAVADAVQVPVVAAGGIADGRGVAAAITLGASAVQIGTGFLRCPEAGIHPVWAEAIARTNPEDTRVSRVFSGRYGRAIATSYIQSATASNAPTPAPYPVQRGLTSPMRRAAAAEGRLEGMQAWAGQSATLAREQPADVLTKKLWAEARDLLR